MSQRNDTDRYDDRNGDRYYSRFAERDGPENGRRRRRDRDDRYDSDPRDRQYDERIVIDRERIERRPPTVLDDRPAPRQPDFLREDLQQLNAGALAVRNTEQSKEHERAKGGSDISIVGDPKKGQPAARIIEQEVISKERIREDLNDVIPVDRRSVDLRGRDGTDDDRRTEIRASRLGEGRTRKEEIIIRETDRRQPLPYPIGTEDSPPPMRRRPVTVEDDVASRRGSHIDTRREYVADEFIVREGRGIPPVRARDFDRPQADYEQLVIDSRSRQRNASLSREQRIVPQPNAERLMYPIAREREEFIFRKKSNADSPPRQASPPPPPPKVSVETEIERIAIRTRDDSASPEGDREEIVITRRESSVQGRNQSRVPSPQLEDLRRDDLPPIIRPSVVQHVYTHHHHIDHGYAAMRSASPKNEKLLITAPAKAQENESIEIDILRKGTRDGKKYMEKEVIIDRVRDDKIKSRRSSSIRAVENVRSGEQDKRGKWTEIAKDLVIREAIERQGYEYKDTEAFFYVADYLEYEDVRSLVQLSEDIKRQRKERERDIQWRREDVERSSVNGGGGDKYDEREKVYEHERIVYDSREGRRRDKA